MDSQLDPAKSLTTPSQAEGTGDVWPPRPISAASQESEVARLAARARLYNIAIGQRNVLWAFIIGFGAVVVGSLENMHLEFVGIILFCAAAIFQIYTVYRLAKAFENLSPVLYIIACLIPCLSLFALLHLVGKATHELTRNGIKVGLFGANPNTILP